MSERKPVVQVRDLTVAGLLDAVSFDLGRGECVAIVDEDDVRRTALLQCIAGVRSPDSGLVAAPPASSVWHADGLPEHLPVEKSIAGLLGSDEEAACELLERVGLAHRAAHEPWAMSAGERRRIAVELALSSGRDLVVLDEPERGLDRPALLWLASRIRGACDEGVTLVLATHSQALARGCADVIAEQL